jgi:hypothetical protein
VTTGCKGCIAWARGAAGIPRNETCRAKISKELEGSGEGRERLGAQRKREMEYFEEALKASDLKKQRTKGPGAGEERNAKRQALDQGEDEERGDQRGGEHVQMEDEVLHLACKEPDEEFLEEDWEEVEGGEDMNIDMNGKYFDDRSGKELETAKVEAAREEEPGELERRVWEVVETRECWDKKGKGPIPVRWVDVHKGFGVHRSRLVAKDFRPKSKVGDREGLFASTPPLEMCRGRRQMNKKEQRPNWTRDSGPCIGQSLRARTSSRRTSRTSGSRSRSCVGRWQRRPRRAGRN